MYPILLDLGVIKIYSFGVFLVAGFLCGLWMTVRMVRAKRLSTFFVFRHLLGLVVMALVGGYLGHLLFGMESHIRYQFMSAIPWASGFSLFGVLIGGWFYLRLALRDDRKLFWQYMDIMTLSTFVGCIFGYVGWFLSGKGLGPYTDLSYLSWSTIERIDLSITGAVHPLGLYMAFLCLCIFLFLVWLKRRKPPVSTLFWVGLFLYAFSVSVVEQFRLVEDSLYWWGEWNINQLFAIVLILTSLGGIYKSQHERL